MAELTGSGSKFVAGAKVNTPAGPGTVHRVVASNPESVCDACGSNRVTIGARAFRYWVVLDGETEDTARKFGEGELA